MYTPLRTADEACCPSCGWTPYDAEEDTCSNPWCRRHWTRLIENELAAEAQRQAAIANLRAANRHPKETTR